MTSGVNAQVPALATGCLDSRPRSRSGAVELPPTIPSSGGSGSTTIVCPLPQGIGGAPLTTRGTRDPRGSTTQGVMRGPRVDPGPRRNPLGRICERHKAGALLLDPGPGPPTDNEQNTPALLPFRGIHQQARFDHEHAYSASSGRP